MEATQALTTYAALLAKVDAKFREVAERQPARLNCGAGCHSCCLPGLTVSPVEAAALVAHLAARPALVAELRALAAADPHRGQRCALLGEGGRCGVYEARPLVCRSHGLPLQVRLEADAAPSRSVCPLNFLGVDLATIDPRDLIDLDTLNTILALLNQQFAPAGGGRTLLTITSLLPEAGAP